MATKSRVNVQQDENAFVEKNILAQAIVDISKAAQALARGGLNRKAIVVLVAHRSKVSQRQCEEVLDALRDLEREYTK